MRYVDLEIKS